MLNYLGSVNVVCQMTDDYPSRMSVKMMDARPMLLEENFSGDGNLLINKSQYHLWCHGACLKSRPGAGFATTSAK